MSNPISNAELAIRLRGLLFRAQTSDNVRALSHLPAHVHQYNATAVTAGVLALLDELERKQQ